MIDKEFATKLASILREYEINVNRPIYKVDSSTGSRELISTVQDNSFTRLIEWLNSIE